MIIQTKRNGTKRYEPCAKETALRITALDKRDVVKLGWLAAERRHEIHSIVA
jgi:hypothetical protein